MKNLLKEFCSVIIMTGIIVILTVNVSFLSAQSTEPVLYFSDITSGPKTGNSDISSGRIANQDGAIVTIWGTNLNAVQGTSKVFCNGAEAAFYYFWGNAEKPANLYVFHLMQMISFQISHLANDGLGEIYIEAESKKSNSLSFTVRDGNIYFVKTSGNDETGDGSWSNPWRTINKPVATIAPGDITYICDGVKDTTETDASACVNLSSDGLPGMPKALIVYPEATALVGSNNVERSFHTFNPEHETVPSSYWVLAKFNILTYQLGLPAQTGFRVIGNYITAPNGDGADGAIDIGGNDAYVLGNELFDVGTLNCDKLYHVIYAKGTRLSSGPRAATERNREIGWNFIHQCKANRAIDIYSEQDFSAFIENHKVHDNVIFNQRGDGILLGYYVTGNNWIYNNLLIRVGLGPNWEDPTYHIGLHLNPGHEENPNTEIFIYNNTMYDCGFSESFFPGETGHILITPESINFGCKYNFSNNIIYSKGEPYIAGESVNPPTGNYLNCWYGDGLAPDWDLAAINSDPQFENEIYYDLRLKEGSPCINSGIDVSSVVERDLLGFLRPRNDFDLGVYENSSVSSIIENDEHFNIYVYPNPFSELLITNYELQMPARVKIDIYNSLGNKITTLVDEYKDAGKHQAEFNAEGLPQGMYYYTVQIGERRECGKLLLIK